MDIDAKARIMFKSTTLINEDHLTINPDDIADGLFIIRKGKLVYVNKAASLIFGYSHDMMMQMDFPDYAVSDDLCIMQGVRISRMSKARTPEKFEYFIKLPDGRTRRVSLRISFSDDGMAYVTARDISEHAEIESSLEEISLKYRELVELLPQAVYETDLTLKLTYVNESAFSMFGYTREDFIRGISIRDIIPFEEWNKAFGGITHVLAGGVTRGKEYLARRKDGSIFAIEAFSTPLIRSGAVAGMRGIIIDRSERKEHEREVEYLRLAMKYLLDNADHGIVIIDTADNRILSGSDKAKELFAFEHGTVAPVYLRDFIPKVHFCGPDRTVCDDAVNPVLRAVAGENIESEIIGICHSDDVVIWTSFSSVTIAAPGGKKGIAILQFRGVEQM